MKIELLTPRSGLSGSQNKGDVIDVERDEAERMIAAGQAALFRGSQPEKAVARGKPEKAGK